MLPRCSPHVMPVRPLALAALMVLVACGTSGTGLADGAAPTPSAEASLRGWLQRPRAGTGVWPAAADGHDRQVVWAPDLRWTATRTTEEAAERAVVEVTGAWRVASEVVLRRDATGAWTIQPALRRDGVQDAPGRAREPSPSTP
jgi:hypothetical protein